jgi:hypothetical protein
MLHPFQGQFPRQLFNLNRHLGPSARICSVPLQKPTVRSPVLRWGNRAFRFTHQHLPAPSNHAPARFISPPRQSVQIVFRMFFEKSLEKVLT